MKWIIKALKTSTRLNTKWSLSLYKMVFSLIIRNRIKCVRIIKTGLKCRVVTDGQTEKCLIDWLMWLLGATPLPSHLSLLQLPCLLHNCRLYSLQSQLSTKTCQVRSQKVTILRASYMIWKDAIVLKLSDRGSSTKENVQKLYNKFKK
jgi:hypothetical protein